MTELDETIETRRKPRRRWPLIGPDLYRSSQVYDFFMKVLGYESSLNRFLKHLALEVTPRCRILDAGCGTGVLGLHFLERIADSTLCATDLEPNLLQAMLVNADKRGLDRDRISTGIADISVPGQLTAFDGTLSVLEDASFDLICIGAVVGYAKDIEVSLCRLLRLLSPGGCLLNIEMNERPTGRFVSHRYGYYNIPLDRMRQVIQQEGCEVSTMKLNRLPARLTRTVIIARKPSSEATASSETV